MAYSEDFRRRAVEYMDAGHTGKELYEAFKIYPTAIARWRKLELETGTLEAEYNETRSGKIDMEKLKQAIEEKPDLYLSELAELFGCTKQAIFYALKRIGITRKKRHLHTAKSQR